MKNASHGCAGRFCYQDSLWNSLTVRDICAIVKWIKCNAYVGELMMNYEAEARARWSNTDAYREHKEKTKHYSKEKWAEVNDGLMKIFAEFAVCKDSGAASDSVEAKALAAKLQAYITEHFYTCTAEILAGLGKMYMEDERFKNTIDTYSEGTAAYAANAIHEFCKEIR